MFLLGKGKIQHMDMPRKSRERTEAPRFCKCADFAWI